MEPEAFLTFREYTDGASAIQSRSYKTVESLCRTPDDDRLAGPGFDATPEVRERVLAGQPTVQDAVARCPDPAGEIREAMAAFEASVLAWRRTHFNLAMRVLGQYSTVEGRLQWLEVTGYNKPLVAAGAASAYIASGGALTETYNSADNTYSVTQAAMNIQIGSQSISYNSWTSPHLAPGTKYYFALNDPNWAGGSAPLVYSTAQTSTLNNDGYVTAANYTTGASGGGGGGSGGAGSGSGTCVALTAYLLPDVLASRARAGMRIDGAAGFKITGKTVITNVAFFTAPCVMVTAADGCQLPCSTTTSRW